MNCVIIDDEPKAIAVLQRYVEKITDLDLSGAFDNPLEAMQFLKSHKPGCLFLDINMPDIDGLQLSRFFENIPIVFTTAYPQFALESYEVNAVDYLLKPIALPRFLKAVDKIRTAINAANLPPETPHPETIFIKSSTKTYRILINEIIYLETLGNNIIFHTYNMEVSSRFTVAELFNILPKGKFIRIHKSFIASKKEIQIIESHQVTTQSGFRLPIGAAYRKDLRHLIELLKRSH